VSSSFDEESSGVDQESSGFIEVQARTSLEDITRDSSELDIDNAQLRAELRAELKGHRGGQLSCQLSSS
jgi:hypothetical protein